MRRKGDGAGLESDEGALGKLVLADKFAEGRGGGLEISGRNGLSVGILNVKGDVLL